MWRINLPCGDPSAPLRLQTLAARFPLEGTHYSASGLGGTRLMFFHEPVRIAFHQLEKPIVVAAHHGFIIPAGTPAFYEAAHPAGLHHSWVRADGHWLPSRIAEFGLPLNQPIPLDPEDTPERWLEMLRAELHWAPAGDSALMQGILRLWLDHLSRQHSRTAPTIDPRIASVRQALLEHFDKPLRLTDYAAAVRLASNALCTAFTQAYGIAPMALRKQLRLEYGRELLECTRLSVGEIAARCGYGDLYQFSKAFKQHWGHSPKHFRA